MGKPGKRVRIRYRIVAWMIGRSVPLLNVFRRPGTFAYSLAQLRAFPPGTLASETASFLDSRDFDLLPKYEVHDTYHTLLDYGTTATGELRLQAFMWGNGTSSFAGRVLFIIGIVALPDLWPQLRLDYARGQSASRLDSVEIEGLLGHEIEDLRTELNIRPERLASAKAGAG